MNDEGLSMATDLDLTFLRLWVASSALRFYPDRRHQKWEIPAR
jgi:hypothetical protein